MHTRISRSLVAALICLAAWQGAYGADSNYAEDRSEIENLQARYLFALDFRDADAYASTFTEDGVLDYGAGEIKGRPAIANMVRGMREADDAAIAADESGLRPATGRHSITNIVVEIDGDHAVARAYWFHMGNANAERGAQLNSYGHYEDELERVNGEWLFSLRKIYNEQVADWVASRDNPAW